MQNRILVEGDGKGKKKRAEKRYHSIVKIVFVAATHNCMYINRVGRHVDHPTKTNDQTNKSKFFRGFIVEILIIHTQYRQLPKDYSKYTLFENNSKMSH